MPPVSCQDTGGKSNVPNIHAVDLVTLTVTGGLPLIPGISAPITLGEVRLLTLLLASELTASNLSNQLIDVGLFVKAGKPLGAPTGNKYYDAYKETVEAFILQLDYLALVARGTFLLS